MSYLPKDNHTIVSLTVNSIMLLLLFDRFENIEDFANGVAGSIKYKMGEGH